MSEFNNKPYFLLYGANGWIGSQVYDLLVTMGIKVVKSNCRADDYNSVESEIMSITDSEGVYSITHVMSFIGRTHGIYDGETISTIDYLEKPGKLVENMTKI
jgi:hypothetical protein